MASEIEDEARSRPEFTDWSGKPLRDLIRHIEEGYHRRLRRDLPDLVQMAEKVEQVHADKPACPRGLAEHLRGMHESVILHMEKEERVLFPLIQAGRGRSALAPIRVMEKEHEDHGVSLTGLRELATGFAPPAEACTTWKALYLRLETLESELMEHIHLENNVLFPRALRG